MDNKKLKKVREVILTDIQVHAIEPINPKPLNRQVEKSIKSGKPGRAYTTDFEMKPDGTILVRFPNYDSDGTPIKYLVPKEGLKVYLSSDAVDKLKSLNKNKNVT